jgi:hypothetical protein
VLLALLYGFLAYQRRNGPMNTNILLTVFGPDSFFRSTQALLAGLLFILWVLLLVSLLLDGQVLRLNTRCQVISFILSLLLLSLLLALAISSVI